jgi:hypothetical protein
VARPFEQGLSGGEAVFSRGRCPAGVPRLLPVSYQHSSSFSKGAKERTCRAQYVYCVVSYPLTSLADFSRSPSPLSYDARAASNA